MEMEDESGPHAHYDEVPDHPAERNFDMEVHPSQRHSRRLRKRSMLAAAALCFGVGYTASHASLGTGVFKSGGGSAPSAASTTAELDVVRLEIDLWNDYTAKSPIYSPHWYSVVEPYRDTTFSVSDSTSEQGVDDPSIAYMWHIGDVEMGPGKTVRYVFKQMGRHDIDVVKVEILEDGSHRHLGMTKIEVTCKYVRREIRTLSDMDRDLFLDTVGVLQNLPTEDGQVLYGSKYKDKDYFIKLHLLYGANDDCDNWHEGAGFVGSHMALTLEYEQSLQAVHPAASVPYWDFTLESTFYNEENWRQSLVFNPDWFGDAAPKNDAHTITEGRFAYVPTKTNAFGESSITNSYGLLRAPWNNDPSPFLTRHDYINGVFNNLKPRGCDGFAKCMTFSTWRGVATCLNTDAHGHIHELIGGSWGHKKDYVGTNATNSSYEIMTGSVMPSALDFVHVTQAMSKELWRSGFLVCPDVCSMDTPEAECMCECPAETMEADAYEVLHEAGVFKTLSFFDSGEERITSAFSEEHNRTEYRLAGKTPEMEAQIWSELVENLCDVGKIGDMYQASSPNDITFWVLHPTLDRLWHWIRLSASHDNFDDTWDYDENACYGHNPDDLQPWTGELFGMPDEGQLTNAELYTLMSPGTDQMPYVYDNYEWSHCTALGYDMTYSGKFESYYTEENFLNTNSNEELPGAGSMTGVLEDSGVFSAVSAVLSSMRNLFTPTTAV